MRQAFDQVSSVCCVPCHAVSAVTALVAIKAVCSASCFGPLQISLTRSARARQVRTVRSPDHQNEPANPSTTSTAALTATPWRTRAAGSRESSVSSAAMEGHRRAGSASSPRATTVRNQRGTSLPQAW